MTKVVNRHHNIPFDFYIGRGSFVGNSWSHDPRYAKDHFLCKSREDSIKEYGTWLRQACAYEEEFCINVLKLKGKTLGCSCKPLACHGDVLAEFIDSYDFFPVNEGRDHINIYSKSNQELGRLLSNFAHTPFECEGLKFASVEGYWYWLKTGRKHDELRNFWGIDAKTRGKELEVIEVENFNELILEAIRCKLRQNKKIQKLLKDSTLALTHYYYFGNINEPKIVRLNKYNWIVDEIERIRNILHKHT